MGRGKIVAVPVVASLIGLVALVALMTSALLVVRPSRVPDPESEDAAAWLDAAPDIEEIFASKRPSAQRPGNATGPSSHRAAAQAERELARATSALDQAHARLAAKRVDVSRAELAFERTDRRIAILEASSEASADQREYGMDGRALETEARERARLNREQARLDEATEQVNLRSAEERLKVAELEHQSSSSLR